MIKFSGSRTDFALFQAERLKAYHHNFLKSINTDTLHRQLKIYQKFYPELILETRTIADHLHQNPDLLLYEYLASFVDFQRHRVSRYKHGCTIFALRENGQVFVGRNYDWLPSAREFFERYDLEITGAHRYFAFTDEGVWGRHIGKRSRDFYVEDIINQYGLYAGLTASHIDQWNYGLSPSHLLRYVAEHCKTTRQALNAFAKIPCAVPKNFLIADTSGNLATVEHSSRKHAIIHPNDQGILIHTNHCLDPKLQRLDHTLKHNPHSSTYVRYSETEFLVRMQLPNFQFTDLWRILRQSHYVYNPKTIWSLALELTSGRFNLYYDTASGQKHTKFHF